jgi:energy-coupling factor transport system ATP-binding protein
MGTVTINGQDPAFFAPAERAAMLGFLTQVPDDQLLCSTILDEMCFGLESTTMPLPEIEPLARRWLTTVGLSYADDTSPQALSGGEKQRLVLGASLAAGAKTILLDEPLSQLDPPGARSVMNLLRGMADEGWTIVIIEHRLDAVWRHADRLIALEGGQIACDCRPANAPILALRHLGLSVPKRLDYDLRVEQGETRRVPPATHETWPDKGPCLLKTDGISIHYPNRQKPAIACDPLTVIKGERISILGVNGSGKSSLLEALLSKAEKDGVHAVLVPQNADLTLFNSTVEAEVNFGRSGSDITPHPPSDPVSQLGLSEYRNRAPHALSKGQRLRVAVASALACKPQILMLDEPTAGQDQSQMQGMMDHLTGDGPPDALIFTTHDVALALEYSTRVIVLQDGRIQYDGPPLGATHALTELPEWVEFCLSKDLPIVSPDRLFEGSDD